MTQYTLVKFSDNWADEMDIEGFRVYSTEEWNNIRTALDNPSLYPMEIYFGTNESNEYRDYNALFSKITEKQITKTELEFLQRLLSINYTYGNCPFFEDLAIDEEAEV